MKLLPKKADIDRAKASERKMEIDEGMNLARQVDDLRRLRAEEERNVSDYRNGMMKAIHAEIDSLIEDRDNLLKWNTEARAERQSLLEPLDAEWEKFNLEKKSLGKEKEDMFISRETLKAESMAAKEEKKAILALIAKSKRKKAESQIMFDEAVTFSENARAEREKAISERKSQSNEHSAKMADANLLIDTYQNGVNVNALEEARLAEWEEELIIREQALERGQKTLQAAKKELQQ